MHEIYRHKCGACHLNKAAMNVPPRHTLECITVLPSLMGIKLIGREPEMCGVKLFHAPEHDVGFLDQ